MRWFSLFSSQQLITVCCQCIFKCPPSSTRKLIPSRDLFEAIKCIDKTTPVWLTQDIHTRTITILFVCRSPTRALGLEIRHTRLWSSLTGCLQMSEPLLLTPSWLLHRGQAGFPWLEFMHTHPCHQAVPPYRFLGRSARRYLGAPSARPRQQMMNVW